MGQKAIASRLVIEALRNGSRTEAQTYRIVNSGCGLSVSAFDNLIHKLKSLGLIDSFGTYNRLLRVPVRSQRVWWRSWAKDQDSIVFLNPVKFVGYNQAYPTPLCVGYRGKLVFEFEQAFRDLGGALS